VSDRVRFEVASASSFSGRGYDLVTMFDCLHGMGDPVGAARHVRQALAPDGTWMIVEPIAGDRVEDNLNPVGRLFYGFSTLLCTPASLSQDVGLALGAQAGESRTAAHDQAQSRSPPGGPPSRRTQATTDPAATRHLARRARGRPKNGKAAVPSSGPATTTG
jgi:hypothetical protein